MPYDQIMRIISQAEWEILTYERVSKKTSLQLLEAAIELLSYKKDVFPPSRIRGNDA